ncbi:MAG: hypothetical protein BWY28_03220 [bacterium ADurb.Bin236]|nr:MAG: hypothetical protein BWY28_03220 [bacterium ADurb.Bin236]
MFLAMKMKTFKHDVCGVNDAKCKATVCGELCLPKSEEAGLCGVNDASCAETVCRTDPATEKGETLKAELAN